MKISILGAGIAGLSCAIALKNSGFDVQLFERDREPRNIGAGIVCWPNATYVLDKLDLLQEVEKVSGCPESMDRISHLGEPLGSLDILQINEIAGYPSYSILRKDLMVILLARVSGLGIDIHFDHRLTGFDHVDNGSVLARFSNGNKVRSEILIGADGRMNSVARKFICGDNAPVYQEFINWIGVYESTTDLFRHMSVQDYWGVGERFGIVPVDTRTAYWAGGVAATEIGSRDPDLYKAELLALFDEWPDPVPEIIRASHSHSINKIFVHDHNPASTWYRGNVLMIGDAAHAPLPTSGQGACQALEDAWHLATMLGQDHSSIEQTFSAFMQLRVSKTTGIIESGRNLAASLFNTDEAYCQRRNENSRNTDFGRVASAMAGGWMAGLPVGGRPV